MRFLMIAIVALGLVSCGGEEKTAAEKTAYNLDAKASTLKWKGSKDSSYFHVGSVKVTEGKIEMEGDNLISGSFKIDMNTVVAEDTTLPEDKKAMLSTHLKDTAFFFASKFPTVDVTVSGYKDGKLATTINLLGKEIKQDIPVTLAITDDGVEISGTFNLDVTALNMEGLKPSMPEDKAISPIFEFNMNLLLKK
jgi:polyisoprenoid-binding protein YceI